MIKTTFLTPALYSYLLEVSLRDPLILQELRSETVKQFPDSHMQTAAEQTQLLSFLFKLMNGKHILDVGTFTGHSALAFALAAPADGEVITCDCNDQTTQVARHFFEKSGVGHKIKFRLGPALETLSDLRQHHYQADFIFIDADKINLTAYYELSLELVRPGGMIAVDNVLWSGAVSDPVIQDVSTLSIRAFNQHVSQDTRVDITLVPVGDGLMLARKKPSPRVL